jgi:Dolichyl-phosphate-mannose-protein mannosyltransferase
VSVGLAFWAKYALIMLLFPFAIAMLFHKPWRAHLFTLKPYLALLIACIIIAPHVYGMIKIADVARIPIENAGFSLKNAGMWLLNSALLAAPIALFTWKYNKPSLPLFATLAAIAPVLFVLVLSLLTGIRPRPLWLTPFILGFALWGAWIVKDELNLKPLYAYTAVILCLWLAAKVVAPIISDKAHYADFDAKATLNLVKNYAAENQVKPDYLVSFGAQRGRQLAGSLVFESRAKIQVLEEGSSAISPWIDTVNLLKSGAIIVSTRAFTPQDKVLGQPITAQKQVTRPLGSRPFKEKLLPSVIYLGVVR